MKLGPGLTFSFKRAIGVTKVKRSISKTTGIPLTRSGRRMARYALTAGSALIVYQ